MGMSLIKEFREFAIRGNVIDLAVGVIIGAAFGKIVDSIVNDIIMPPLGYLLGKVDFKNLYVDLAGQVPPGTAIDTAKKTDGAIILAFGNLFSVALQFLIIAFVIFLMVKALNKVKSSLDAAPVAAEPSTTDQLLAEIRDELRKSGPRGGPA
jgi:large conductance mechanosensitive channel